MKLEELKEWIKSNKCITIESENYDSSTNYYQSRIYKDNDGKLYRLEFINDYPYEKYIQGKGYSRNDYAEPVEVEARTREEIYYEEKKTNPEIVAKIVKLAKHL